MEDEFRKNGLEKIWLIDMGDEISWCDCPSPANDMEYDDSTGYIRMDIYQELKQENQRLKQGFVDVSLYIENCQQEMLPVEAGRVLAIIGTAIAQNKEYTNQEVGGE